MHIVPFISASLPSPHHSSSNSNNNHRLLIDFNQPIPIQTDTHFHWSLPHQHASTVCVASARRIHCPFYQIMFVQTHEQKKLKQKTKIRSESEWHGIAPAAAQRVETRERKKNTHSFVHTVPFTRFRSKTFSVPIDFHFFFRISIHYQTQRQK